VLFYKGKYINWSALMIACVLITVLVFNELIVFPRCKSAGVLEYQYKLANQGIGKFQLNKNDELEFVFTCE